MAGTNERIQFTIEGLTVRGFYENICHWVPQFRERLECKINTNSAITAFKEGREMGNVPKEWSGIYRKWLNKGGKLEAFVQGLHKVHRTKGKEVPVVFLFTGDSKPLFINMRNSIKQETLKKAKKKKSLKFYNEDRTEELLSKDVGGLVNIESMERQTDKLDFTVSGMSLRGFFIYERIYVPEIGDRHECFISDSSSIAVKIRDNEICGNIPTDVQKLWKKFIRNNGNITAVVNGLPKKHRTKGLEIPVQYIFTGEMTCILKNLRREIIADILKKCKKKKSLGVNIGDVTQSPPSPPVSRNPDDVANEGDTDSDEESTFSNAEESNISEGESNVSNKIRASNVNKKSKNKVSRKRRRQESSNKVNASKKSKKSQRHEVMSPMQGDYEIVMKETDFSKLSQIIGYNWYLLGIEMGLSDTQISRIDINSNYNTPEIKIYQMFMKCWRKFPEKNFLGYLMTSVNECREIQIEKEPYK